MVESMLPDGEKVLAGRLKQEAETLRPEFSESLHARICGALQSSEASPQRPATRSRRRIAYACAAVACLVVALVVAWQLAVPHTPEADPGDATPIAQTSEQLGVLYALSGSADPATAGDSALPSQDWAYLGHDARVVTQLLIDQLPLNTLASNGDP